MDISYGNQMTYVVNTCPYCKNGKKITANRTSWLIHLASHREEIIDQLVDTTTSCVFCSYPELHANTKHAASHYRWAHQKSTLLNWALDMISNNDENKVEIISNVK